MPNLSPKTRVEFLGKLECPQENKDLVQPSMTRVKMALFFLDPRLH